MKVSDEDVFVGGDALGLALEGDEVEVAITGRGDRGPRGKVLRVLSRTPRRLSGIVDAGGRFIPDDIRYGRPLRCSGSAPGPEEVPSLCGAELLSQVDGSAPEVRIERSFGKRGSAQAEEEALLWRERMNQQFPSEALAEAEDRSRVVYEEDDPHRLDWRAIDFITIDPETAEDHDDAVFAKRLPDGSIRLFVAIADVSAFVPEGGALDLEARRRSASLYLPGQVVPMLPPVLSNQAASLVPDEDRAAMVLELRLDPEIRVRSHRVALALVRSRAKLTYQNASEVLESRGASGAEKAKKHAETILLLDELAQHLRARRKERGAIAFETSEVVIQTDERGLPARIARASHGPWLSRAHQLVEELMLLANETVAGMLREKQAKALFRTHDAPSGARAMQIIEAARRHGVELDASVALDPAALRKVVRAISDRALRDEFSALLLDAMPSALYASHRQDHFALATRHYVHFTSPIRRYADLTIHRAIRRTLNGDSAAPNDIDTEEVNRGQQRARAIQREVADLYAALLMQHRTGETYRGTILRALKHQWIVALEHPAVCVRCVRPAAQLEEGASIDVRIESVSIASRTIEASFVAGPTA